MLSTSVKYDAWARQCMLSTSVKYDAWARQYMLSTSVKYDAWGRQCGPYCLLGLSVNSQLLYLSRAVLTYCTRFTHTEKVRNSQMRREERQQGPGWVERDKNGL